MLLDSSLPRKGLSTLLFEGQKTILICKYIRTTKTNLKKEDHIYHLPLKMPRFNEPLFPLHVTTEESPLTSIIPYSSVPTYHSNARGMMKAFVNTIITSRSKRTDKSTAHNRYMRTTTNSGDCATFRAGTTLADNLTIAMKDSRL